MPYPPASLCRFCRGPFPRRTINNHERVYKMQRLTTNDQLRDIKADNFGVRTLTDFEKVGRVELALRNERDHLRKTGGPENIRGANAINTYLQEADAESKLRFANILLQA